MEFSFPFAPYKNILPPVPPTRLRVFLKRIKRLFLSPVSTKTESLGWAKFAFLLELVLGLIQIGLPMWGVQPNFVRGVICWLLMAGLCIYIVWALERKIGITSLGRILTSIGVTLLILIFLWPLARAQYRREHHFPAPESKIPQQTEAELKQQVTSQKEPPIATNKSMKHMKPMQSKRKTPVEEPSPSQQPQPSISAPNGIVIGRDNLGTATVNNTFSDVYPRPGVIPNVNFCIPSTSDNVITITTDTEITAPFWALVFDGPVISATVDMEDADHEPFAWSDGHPSHFPPGQLTEPLGAFPEESRLFLAADSDMRVYTDNVLRIQVSDIGPPFGGPYRPWGPKDHLRVTVKSEQQQPVRLIAIASGYGRKYLAEHMAVGCGK